jgi:hypothetical protein
MFEIIFLLDETHSMKRQVVTMAPNTQNGKPARTTRTATVALAENLIKNEALLQQLQTKLKRYHDAGINGTKDWGYAGTVAHVNKFLQQIVDHLT